MDLPLPVIAVIGIALLGLALLLFRRGDASRDLLAPPTPGRHPGRVRDAPADPEPAAAGAEQADAAEAPTTPAEQLPPFFTANMETALDRAQGFAAAHGDALVTLDHLLLALVDEPDGARALLSRGADLAALRAALQGRIAAGPARPVAAEGSDAAAADDEPFDDEEEEAATRSTDDVQRVLQRTILKVFEARRPANGGDLLESLLQEQGSGAVQALRRCGLDAPADASRPDA